MEAQCNRPVLFRLYDDYVYRGITHIVIPPDGVVRAPSLDW
jgi:hypothetical protein